jgi:Cu+-exporting ATPase
MHCGGCASRVEGRLLALPGVHSADADLGAGLVRVELDPSTTRPGALAEALTAAGYPTTVTG